MWRTGSIAWNANDEHLSGGGVIYTFEFPEIVYGTSNTNSPANTHVLTELFRYIVNHPAPSKKEIMEETKAVLYGNVSSDFYSGLSGKPTGFQIYETGRYGIIPVFRHGEPERK